MSQREQNAVRPTDLSQGSRGSRGPALHTTAYVVRGDFNSAHSTCDTIMRVIEPRELGPASRCRPSRGCTGFPLSYLTEGGRAVTMSL